MNITEKWKQPGLLAGLSDKDATALALILEKTVAVHMNYILIT